MTPKKRDLCHHRHHKNAKKCYDQNRNCRGLKNSEFNKPRHHSKCLRVSELVYRFLENVASVNDERRQRNNARTNFQRAHVRKYSRRSRRPDGPSRSNDQIFFQSKYQVPNESYLETDSHHLPSKKDVHIFEDSDAMGPSEPKSSSQFVKEYVKAVNESKRRSARYICKALSFGVDAGFLVPDKDPEGPVFRVSSTLDAGMCERNKGERKKLDTVDRGNRNTCCWLRGKRQNPKNDESASRISTKRRSKSKSEKSKRKRKKFNFKEVNGPCSPELAKNQASQPKDEKRIHNSEADDLNEPNPEKFSSKFRYVSEDANISDEDHNTCVYVIDV